MDRPESHDSRQLPPVTHSAPAKTAQCREVELDRESGLEMLLDGIVSGGDMERTAILTGDGQKSPEIAGGGDDISSEMIGRLLGRFRLEQALARGGVGIIFKSRDVELDRNVAVKVLLKRHQKNSTIRKQFINEARITGQLQHPGVIPIYQTGTSLDDRPWFAMKLVCGKTLAGILAEKEPRRNQLPGLLKVFEQVCQTLSYCHSRGVIHLDIKPANIMVGEFGEVHLMDWGLARLCDDLCRTPRSDIGPSQSAIIDQAERLAFLTAQQDSHLAAIWGTPAYMAPEQARGECMDVRSDVFGLGSLLCEILTGAPPYEGKNLVRVCLQATQAELRPAYNRLADCDADGVLVRLAMKCLAASPDDRPVDAREVAKEVTMYVESLLHRARSDLDRFFELSLDLFCIAGLDGYFRRVNSNFPRVLGYTEKALISQPFLSFVHPDDRHQTISVMKQLQSGRPVVRFRNRYRTRSDEWKTFEWTAKSIPEEGVIFAVARDVTENTEGSL